MHEAIAQLDAGHTLTEAQATALFRAILGGDLATPQIVAVLTTMASRPETVEELVGAARAMRESVSPVPIDPAWMPGLIDTCGTGGAPKTFNISTAAALIAAGAGSLPDAPVRIRVAKHGNRSRTGRGSAEVLMALGVNVDAPPQAQARCLGDAGVCFSFAIHHHPAMRHAAEARKALGRPTIFNLLGPLTNPAGASRQLLGVFSADKVEPMAHALARLGAANAMVVHGVDGLDEMTTTAPTRIARIDAGTVRAETVDARDLGIPRATLEQLAAGTVEESAAFVRAILAGTPGPRTDIAVWNAAGAICIAGAAPDLADAITLARTAIDSGAAARTLEALIASSQA